MVQLSGWVNLVLGTVASALDHDGFDVEEEAALGNNVDCLSMATAAIYQRNRCKARAKKNA